LFQIFVNKVQQPTKAICVGAQSDRDYERSGIEDSSIKSSSRSDLVHLCSKDSIQCNYDDVSDANAADAASTKANNDATTKLIMQRYKIKSTHYQSPNICKRHHSAESSLEHSMQPGTSTESGAAVIEGAVANSGLNNSLNFARN
uniref:Vulcan n=1 Tax=Gongylonema pulchrum TaxID=637853 RepID=A0A183D5B3_9BILA